MWGLTVDNGGITYNYSLYVKKIGCAAVLQVPYLDPFVDVIQSMFKTSRMIFTHSSVASRRDGLLLYMRVRVIVQ